MNSVEEVEAAYLARLDELLREELRQHVEEMFRSMGAQCLPNVEEAARYVAGVKPVASGVAYGVVAKDALGAEVTIDPVDFFCRNWMSHFFNPITKESDE